MRRWGADVTATIVSIVTLVGLVAIVLVPSLGLTAPNAARAIGPSGQASAPAPGGSVRDFGLTAAPTTLTLKPGFEIPVWAYNGIVPGPELRVTTGDLVRVAFHNQLPVASTIHWHGVPLPNGQDGVPGVTQDPVPAGRTVTYAFIAPAAGTYWYHPHQNSADQLDRGLYGAMVVEPRGGATQAVLEQTLVYDEWPYGTTQPSAPPGDDASMTRYGLYSVNGKTESAIEPLRFSAGELVRLRLVNVGYLTHYLHVHGTSVTITGFDGTEVTSSAPTEGVLTLAAGERLVIEFKAPNAVVWIQAHDPTPPAKQIPVVLLPTGMSVPATLPGANDSIAGQVLDLYAYGASASSGPTWPDGATVTKTFTRRLAELMGHARSDPEAMARMSDMQSAFGIQGKQFPHTGAIEVSAGDRVQVTFVNEGTYEHPMHLHGVSFQVLARNGQPLPGVLVKDTVDVLPGQSITIGFVANNSGWWMLHCHELHHAAGGMDILVGYQGTTRLANLSGPFGASPA